MPICHKIENEKFALGLWELSEEVKELSLLFAKKAPVEEVEKANNFKFDGRKKEWIATRLLIYELTKKVVKVNYDESGKPFLPGYDGCISISHTKGMVAIIVSKKEAAIDIEYLNERVLRIEHKFISEQESKQMPLLKKKENLLAYWCAKETLYKIDGNTSFDFKKNLYIHPFEFRQEGSFDGDITYADHLKTYRLNYFNFIPERQKNNYLVVYYYQ